MGNSKNKEENLSHSQEKRELRKKEVAHARRTAKTWAIVGYVFLAVIAALIIWGIAVVVGKQLDKVTASDDYSAGLDDNGYISGVVASDMVTLPDDYLNMQVDYSEVEYTDDEMQTEIDSQLSSHEEQSTDTTLKIADGDKVNISYVGRIDGEEFDGGSSDSYDLTIGSGTFIDDFEDQLIGHSVGEEVIVDVTFPDDYSTEDLAGKDAEFTVEILGIYVEPEFNDEFVQEYLSDYGSTVDEYKTALREEKERDNLETYVDTYLKDNSTESKYPGKYIKILKSIKKYDDEQSYEYMNQLYSQYYGSSVYDSFEDYVGMTETEYDESLKDEAKETCKENMIYQAIVEKSGETVDSDYVLACMAEDGQDETYYQSCVETSGEPFVLQEYIKTKAIQIVADAATVVK